MSPKEEDRQDQLEDMFADPGPEAAERFWAAEAAASSTASQGSRSAEVLNYDISGGDAADQESDKEDVEQRMIAEGIARNVEEIPMGMAVAIPAAAAARQEPHTESYA
eukprot:1219624-Amphidinium_carterae.4